VNPWVWGGLAAGAYWGLPYTLWQWWGLGVVQRGQRPGRAGPDLR